MKILVIPSWFPPKGGKFFQEQSEALALSGHEVHVLAFNEYSLKEFTLQQQNIFMEHNITIYEKKFWRIPKLRSANEKRFIKQYTRFATKMVEKIQPDILHVHSCCWGGVVANHLHALTNIPYIITEHRGRFLGIQNSQNLIKDWHKPLLIKSLQEAAAIVAVSSQLGVGVASFASLPKEKIQIIPNLVFPFDSVEDRTNDAVFQFAFIGSLEDYKGIDLLVNAILELRKETKQKFCVKVAGKGSLMKAVKRHIQEQQLEENLKLMGQLNRDEISHLLQESHALVSTSTFESFGVNVVEALFHGKPVLVTKSGGPEDIVNENNGMIVKHTAEAVSNGMKKLMSTAKKYDSDRIKKDAWGKYAPEKVVKELEKVLQTAIEL